MSDDAYYRCRVTSAGGEIDYTNVAKLSVQVVSINVLTKGIKEKYKDRFDFKEYVVGSEVSDRSFNFLDGASNLDAGFEFIYSQFYTHTDLNCSCCLANYCYMDTLRDLQPKQGQVCKEGNGREKGI